MSSLRGRIQGDSVIGRAIYIYVYIRLMYQTKPRYSCRFKERVVPFPVLYTCEIQTFL